MRRVLREVVAGLGLGLLLVVTQACGSEDGAGEIGSNPGPVERGTSGAESSGVRSAGGGALPVLAEPRGMFMDWLPKDTLLVLRIPREARSGDAWMQTALARAWSELDLGAGFGTLAEQWSADLFSAWSADLDWDSIAHCLGGEVVFAVVAVHPEAVQPDSAILPFTGVLFAEIDGPREPVLSAVERVVRHWGGTPDFEGLADGTYRARIDTDPCRFEIRLTETAFALGLAPPGSMEGGLDRYTNLEPRDSLRASDLLRSLPPTANHCPGQIAACEFFVNFTPLWKMLLALASAEVQQAFRSLQLEHLVGMSLCMRVDGALLEETLRVHAPRGKDVLTRILTEDVDPSFLRWIPESVQQAGLAAFSPRRALSVIREMMPASMRPQIEAALEEASRSLDIDLEDDLLSALGPNFAVAASGSLEGGDLQVTVAIECRRAEQLSRWVDRRLGRADMFTSRQVYHAGKQPFFGLVLPPLPGLSPEILEVLEPSYAFTDGVLLIGSSPAAMTRTLTAAEADGKLAPRELVQALDGDMKGIWSASYADLGAQFDDLLQRVKPFVALLPMGLPFTDEEWGGFCSRLGTSVNLSRRDALGLEFESRSSLGVATTALLAGGIGFVAEVAMPNVVRAQSQVQESKVVATLREIAEAQCSIKEFAAVDADADGEAEYASLAELAGVLPLRGRGASLSPPLLDSSYGALVEGCFQRDGYLFRLSLADRDGQPQNEDPTGGAPRTAHPDGAEWGWVVYAWPEHLRGATTRVFVIDHTGEIFVTNNEGPTGAYVGLERAPPPDAAYLKSDLRARGARSVRRGLDGALWLREQL